MVINNIPHMQGILYDHGLKLDFHGLTIRDLLLDRYQL